MDIITIIRVGANSRVCPIVVPNEDSDFAVTKDNVKFHDKMRDSWIQWTFNFNVRRVVPGKDEDKIHWSLKSYN